MSESKSAFDSNAYSRAMEHLVGVVQDLSFARTLEEIMSIVRLAARELTGADGATFVLKDGDKCYYAEENAISPLWKGKRFPMDLCISGWSMINRKAAIIEDIYADERIPAEAYRPTFVKSLVMVPIRTADPIGCIGNYWAQRLQPATWRVRVLQALADTTSVAMENVQLYSDLEQRVRDRTAELEAANREFEAFSYAVAHDLRSPLRSIDGFCRILAEKYSAAFDERGRDYQKRVISGVDRMRRIIDDLLELSRSTSSAVKRENVNLGELAREIIADLEEGAAGRNVTYVVPERLEAECDPKLMRVVFENLLGNASKYTSKTPEALVEIGSRSDNGEEIFYVKDNGAGFDAANAEKLFQPFQRFHSGSEFSGTGLGLATVYRIIQKHGGKIWAEATPGNGAKFNFTLS